MKLLNKAFKGIRKAYLNLKLPADRVTPTFIRKLGPNQVFVFGSNVKGLHMGGAAYHARTHFGAIDGKSFGMQGNSFAIPTLDSQMRQVSLEDIKYGVDFFIRYAECRPNTEFLVTPIGCGIAAMSYADIAPLFKDAVKVKNIHLPMPFWEILL